MVTTINRRRGKKQSERISDISSKDNLDQKINDDEYVVDGRIVKTPPESKEVLEMADDDPRILEMMENNLKRWKKNYILIYTASVRTKYLYLKKLLI